MSGAVMTLELVYWYIALTLEWQRKFFFLKYFAVH